VDNEEIAMKKLCTLLADCENLLKSVGETHWRGKIQTALKRIDAASDHYVAKEILSWYGGMGSISDLIISPVNEHRVRDTEEERVNEELTTLRDQIYQEVLRLTRM
jgi:hypothetical protein